MKSDTRPLTITEVVECPKCGKKSVVQRSPDIYQCLACDFRRDFSKPEKSDSKMDFLWPVAIIAFASTLLLMLSGQSRVDNGSSPVPQSSSVSAEVIT